MDRIFDRTGAKQSCECTCTIPRSLDHILGENTDRLVMASTSVNPSDITHLFMSEDGGKRGEVVA